MGTVIVAMIILALVILVIWNMRRDKKQGKSPVCGGNCAVCHGCHTSVHDTKDGHESNIHSMKE